MCTNKNIQVFFNWLNKSTTKNTSLQILLCAKPKMIGGKIYLLRFF